MKVTLIGLCAHLPRCDLLLQVITLNLVTFSTGTTFSWPSPCLPKLTGLDDNPLGRKLSLHEEEWLASLPLLGASLSSFLPILLISKFGRKKALLVLSLPLLVGYLMFSFGSHLAVFLVGRFLCGITLGAAFQIVPRYVGEISETKNRGVMGCFFAVFLAIGHIFNYSVGPYVSFQLFNLLSLIVPILYLLLLVFFINDSPYDFIAKQDLSKAEEILKKLRPNSSEVDIKKEIEEIDRTIKSLENQLKLVDFIHSVPLRRSLLMCVGLVVLQQLSGINAVVSYMQRIFSAGSGDIGADESPIIVGAVQLLATLVTPQVVEKFGRRMLLSVSTLLCAIAMTGLGTYFFLSENDYDTSSIDWLPLVCLMVFIIFFNTGLGSIPYVLMGEVFPSNAKNVSSTITSFCLTLSGFAITWVFPLLIDVIELGITFWIVAGFCYLGVLLILAIVPETKGKTFLEIQKILGG